MPGPRKTVIYVHGMGGSAAEAGHYRPLFPGCEVLGFDYRAAAPREAKEEFSAYFEKAAEKGKIILIANSIGAYFSMQAPVSDLIEKAYFISPVTDMERMILGMMKHAGVTEEELKRKGVIAVPSGPDLSWEYLSFVRSHPVTWSAPTSVLAGDGDELIPLDAYAAFARKTGARLTVMPGGEHWFHTEEQMRFLDDWILNDGRSKD